MAYILRDKNPHNLRDAFRIAINVESNRKASEKLGRRTDGRLWQETKQQPNKVAKEDDKIEKLVTAMKDLTAKVNKNDKPHYNWQDRPPRLHDMPYNTNWKDGKPQIEKPKIAQSQDIPDPLKGKTVHNIENTPWCIACDG